MVAYSFKERFVEPILAGTKRQTIRADRMNGHVRPGGQMQLYSAMRTKHCKLIARAECEGIETIFIDVPFAGIELQGRWLLTREAYWFARSDGFADFDDMLAFWRKEHGEIMFSGVLIRWAPIGGQHG